MPGALQGTSGREIALRASAAVYGLAVAISLLPALTRPASLAQLPGALSSAGVDARATFAFLVAVIVLPIASAWLLSEPIRRVLDNGRTWAIRTASASLLSAMWIALLDRNPAWVAIPPVIVFAGAVALRRFRARFATRDAILLPAAASLFLALFDSLPSLVFYQHVVLSVVAMFALRIGVTAMRGGEWLHASDCFAFAPLGLALQSHFNGYAQRHNGWPVVAIVLLTPIAARLFVRDTRRARNILRNAIAWFVYPVAILMYVSATSLLAAEGKPHADLFENAHHLTPGNEIRRGELPYRDVVVAHGLIQDGLLDAAIIGSGEVTAGRVLEIRGVIGSLVAVAVYAVAWALTGSAHFAMLTFFLGVVLGTTTGSLRVLPALFVLALLVAAVRRRDVRLVAAGGAGTAIAALTSLDFGAYTFLSLLAAVVVMRRRRAVIAAAGGFFGAAALAALAFLAFGIFDDFLRFTFVEIPALGPVYTLPLEIKSPSLQARRFFPDVAASAVDASGFFYVFWFSCLIALGAIVSRGVHASAATRRARVRDSMIVLLVWIVASAISYAERQHLYFHYLAPVVGGGAAYLLIRSRVAIANVVAAVVVFATIIAGQPTHDLVVLSMLRRANGPMSPDLVEIAEVPRAAGAIYRQRDAAIVRIASEYIGNTLAPDQTFFDFTNRGALYFLLGRDLPIRQLEVAFYESPAAQREVIAALEANAKVRLALVPSAGDASTSVDGVPNETRAPLVWKYLRENFSPAFEQDGVVFWQRAAR